MKTIFVISLFLAITGNILRAQSVTLTPQGNTLTQVSLSTTTDISQTGTPTISQLIYNTNAAITGSNANGIGYYYWNGANWQSLDANIPSGTVVFSETHPNQALINSGFEFLTTTTTQVPALNAWIATGSANMEFQGQATISASYGNKFYFWYNIKKHQYTNSIQPQGGGIYNPDNDTWQKMDTLNSPKETYTYYLKLKDRIIGFEDNNHAKIYNPYNNNWTSLDTSNKPIENQYINDKSSNYLFYWNGSNGKYFNAITNQWLNISQTNALLDMTEPWQIDQKLHDNKVFLYHRSTQVLSIFNLETNTWVTVSSNNQPLIGGTNYLNDEYYELLSFENDTLLFRNVKANNISLDSVIFKRYSISQNTWFDDIPNLYTENRNSSTIQYITRLNNNEMIFNVPNITGWGRFDIQIYKLINNSWSSSIFTSNGRGLEEGLVCGENLVFLSGGINRFTPLFYDGFKLNMKDLEWTYLSSPLNKAANGNNCCNQVLLMQHSSIYNEVVEETKKYFPSAVLHLNITQLLKLPKFYICTRRIKLRSLKEESKN